MTSFKKFNIFGHLERPMLPDESTRNATSATVLHGAGVGVSFTAAEHERATIAVATGVSPVKEVAEKTFAAELAMTFNCVSLTPDPIPREYTCTFLFLSGREASKSSVNGPQSVVCSPSVITIAICGSSGLIPAAVVKTSLSASSRALSMNVKPL